MKLKICGLTDADDVRRCARYADALGFIVDYPESKRSVSSEQAKELMKTVPPFIASVIVIPDFSKAFGIYEKLNPKVIQLHGKESPEEVKNFAEKVDCQVIKACGHEDARKFAPFVDMILLDDKYSPIDLEEVQKLIEELDIPIILAGHINPENVANILSKVSPYGIDVASGIESNPGKKDIDLVIRMRKMLDLGSTVRNILVDRKPQAPSKFAVALESSSVSVITEIKPGSPSEGSLRDVSNDLESIVSQMEKGGASAISVLVEEKGFGGSPELLAEVGKYTNLPLLAKGFIVDFKSISELSHAGASAILLMPRVLDAKGMNLVEIINFAGKLKLDSVVEVADARELELALNGGARIIQINNRDIYDSLDIDLDRSRLGIEIPLDCIFISASGIDSAEDLDRMFENTNHRVDAVLVGTGIMLAASIQKKVEELVSHARELVK